MAARTLCRSQRSGCSYSNDQQMPSFMIMQVEAVVLKLMPLVEPLVNVDFELFQKVVRCLFHFRRKFVRRGTMWV